MKQKVFIKKLRDFSKNEGIFINQFLDKFEKHIGIEKEGKKKRKKYLFNKESYQEYLNNEQWKEIRQRVIDKIGRRCEGCDSDKSIQVHHTVYSKKVIEGKSLKGLRVTCRDCHRKIHDLVNGGMSLKKATLNVLGEIKQKKKPKKKPQHSLRIVKSSGLPETLHHSLMTVRGNFMDLSTEKFINKYESRKKKDEFIEDLYKNNKTLVIRYLNSL